MMKIRQKHRWNTVEISQSNNLNHISAVNTSQQVNSREHFLKTAHTQKTPMPRTKTVTKHIMSFHEKYTA